MKKLIALGAALALLAACASGASSFRNAQRHDWSCANGRAFSVRFANEKAELFAAGKVHVLNQSGGRYSDGQVQYWQDGSTAHLEGAFGGPYENCRERS